MSVAAGRHVVDEIDQAILQPTNAQAMNNVRNMCYVLPHIRILRRVRSGVRQTTGVPKLA